MADFTLAALKTELDTDPMALGYAPHIAAARVVELAALLNEVRVTIAISRGVIDTHEIFEATDPTEWAALSADEKQRYQGLLGMGTLDVGGTNVVSAFQAMFAVGATRTALIALRTRNGSRSEELFSPNFAVSYKQIAEALKL